MTAPLSSPEEDSNRPCRPPLDPTPLASSDESTSTLSSTSSSTSSLDHPYSRLVIQDRSSNPRSAFDLNRSHSYDDRCIASGSQSLPSSRTSSFNQHERDSLVPLRALREGRTESFAVAPPRHQSLAPLLPPPLPAISPASPSSSSASSTYSHSTSNTSNTPPPPSASAPIRSAHRLSSASNESPDQSPTTTYFPRTHLLTRSHSFGSAPRPDPRSPSYPTSSPFAASPFAYPLPNSTSNHSSLGGRPMSGGTCSTSTTTSSTSCRPWVRDSDASSVASGGSCPSEDAEVYRVAEGDVVEFLDPRPEPPGAKLTVDRDDPTQVIVHVVLPGFSLDNITVAMRRGHKVHIVADSYGENGGHFEKLIFLGSDVSSAAPRAEFNGTELHVYVARRQPSKPIRSSSPLPPPTDSSSNPIVTHSTGPPERAKVRILTGPEGAKAAAKAAREEATLRAKEAAKVLPKVGSRKAPFAQLLRPPERSGTITQRSHSSEAVATTEEEEEEQPTSPARPKFRPTDLTLRAGEATFLEAAKEEEGKGEGGRTPRGENAGMRFSMEIGTAL